MFSNLQFIIIMEILNNRQLIKQNRRSFHYRPNDHSSPNGQRDLAIIDNYSILENDLILIHKKYYDRMYEATDAIRDWKLINVDKNDCDPKKLDRLIKDHRIEEVKIAETKNGKKLVFYSSVEVYSFSCEEIEQEVRGYNRKEILDILVEKEEYLTEIDTQNSKMYEFVGRLARFINGESRDYRNLFALNQNKDISVATKSEHYLEILTRVKGKLEDLLKELPEDMLKYRGILV